MIALIASGVAVITGLVAIIIGLTNTYKTFFQAAKASISTGDTMEIIRVSEGRPRRIHIRGVISNAGAKMGTLQRLEAMIEAPNGETQRYVWNLFFKGVPGTTDLEPDKRPVPIPISGKDSQPLMVELKLHEPQLDSNWQEGRHKVTLKGWVNRKSRGQESNVSHRFHINISSEQASFLPIPLSEPGSSQAVIVPIEEWDH